MRKSVTIELSLPTLANPRYAELNQKELKGRTIGGDSADLHFRGYTLVNGCTVLVNCEISRDDLNQDETNELATTILMESYNSIGVECVEHN